MSAWLWRRLCMAASVVLMPWAGIGGGSDALVPIDPRHVRVQGEIGRRIDITIHNNLLKVDLEKDFLAPFRAHDRASGYIGLGKTIDAAVRFAAYTNEPAVIEFKRKLVDETLALQAPDGYIGLMKPEARVSGLWDVHEAGYIVYGLLSDYEFFGNEAALSGARKLADYIVANWDRIPADWGTRTGVATHVAVTGLERTLFRLYTLTKDGRYLEFLLNARALESWDLPIVIGRRPLIEGHVYAYVARCLAQVELYRVRATPGLLTCSRRAIDFMLRGEGMAITGGVGQWEIWTDDQDGRGELGETCASAYQMRLFDSMLRLEGDARYGDVMERMMYNTLFAAQSPDGRHLRYFAPIEGPRVFHPGDTYCCPCNYRRIIAELPAMIYYRVPDGGGAAINLYAPSEASFERAPGQTLRIRQDTDYPNTGRVTIHVDPATPAAFALKLRIPRWSARRGRATINGKVCDALADGAGFLTLERTWNAGDRVVLDMPMEWRFVTGRQRQSGRVAVMRGPMVFCLDPAQDAGLATLDAADLNRMVLDPASIEGPLPDDSVRPDGLACRVRMAKASFGMGGGGEPLRLTEFADPDGRCVYFRVSDPADGCADELLTPRQ